MSALLRHGLHFCICSGRSVFLDVRADRYFCLPYHVDEAFQQFIAGECLPARAQENLEVLYTRGILLKSADQPVSDICPPIAPAVNDLGESAEECSAWDCVRAIAFQYALLSQLRRKPFSKVLGGITRHYSVPPGGGGSDFLPARRVAAAFARTRILFRTQDRCLAQSIAFQRMCLSRHFQCSLVIGVNLNPFSAHCWVQRDDHVINDSLEHVRSFTPILAV